MNEQMPRNMELLSELHPSTCEHQECKIICEQWCEQYEKTPEKEVAPVKISDVYTVEPQTIHRTIPKKELCELCRGELRWHTSEICKIQVEAQKRASEAVAKWYAENKHKWGE